MSDDRKKSRERLRALRPSSEPVPFETLNELARLAKEEEWTPAQVRAALEALHLEAQDETDKPPA